MRAGTVPAASDRCLDAETAGAWLDGALPAEAASLAEARAPAVPPPAERKQSADLRRRDDQGAAKNSDAPPAAAAPAATLNETVAVGRRDAVGRLDARAVEIASPDASIRWRIGAAGMVQRSSDGGATWETLSIGATEDLTAASAPSATVCWIAGRAGTVLLTTNGREWQRVAF